MDRPPVLGVHESSLYVADLDRSAAFYNGVLGFHEIGREPGRHVFVQAGSDVLLLFNAEATRHPSGEAPPHFGSGQLHVAFGIAMEDLDRWRQQLHEAGVQVEREVTWPTGGRSLYFRDPDNHSIELVTRGTWGYRPAPG